MLYYRVNEYVSREYTHKPCQSQNQEEQTPKLVNRLIFPSQGKSGSKFLE